MNCDDYKLMLATDYLDGEASGRSLRKIEDHTAHCASCREYGEALKAQSLAGFRDLPGPVPSGAVWNRIRQRVVERELLREDAARRSPGLAGFLSWFQLKRLPYLVPPALALFLLCVTFVPEHTGVVAPETGGFIMRQVDVGLDNEPAENDENMNFGTVIEDFFIG